MTERKDQATQIIDLESHLAHHERMIQDLSDMVARQWDTINGVLTKLDRLESRLRETQDQGTEAEEPPPPHY